MLKLRRQYNYGFYLSQGNTDIRVVGVGGAGMNAVNRMIEAGMLGVEFIGANTDIKALIHDIADDNVEIIFGQIFDETIGDNARVTVVATGFNGEGPIGKN